MASKPLAPYFPCEARQHQIAHSSTFVIPGWKRAQSNDTFREAIRVVNLIELSCTYLRHASATYVSWGVICNFLNAKGALVTGIKKPIDYTFLRRLFRQFPTVVRKNDHREDVCLLKSCEASMERIKLDLKIHTICSIIKNYRLVNLYQVVNLFLAHWDYVIMDIEKDSDRTQATMKLLQKLELFHITRDNLIFFLPAFEEYLPSIKGGQVNVFIDNTILHLIRNIFAEEAQYHSMDTLTKSFLKQRLIYYGVTMMDYVERRYNTIENFLKVFPNNFQFLPNDEVKILETEKLVADKDMDHLFGFSCRSSIMYNVDLSSKEIVTAFRIMETLFAKITIFKNIIYIFLKIGGPIVKEDFRAIYMDYKESDRKMVPLINVTDDPVFYDFCFESAEILWDEKDGILHLKANHLAVYHEELKDVMAYVVEYFSQMQHTDISYLHFVVEPYQALFEKLVKPFDLTHFTVYLSKMTDALMLKDDGFVYINPREKVHLIGFASLLKAKLNKKYPNGYSLWNILLLVRECKIYEDEETFCVLNHFLVMKLLWDDPDCVFLCGKVYTRKCTLPTNTNIVVTVKSGKIQDRLKDKVKGRLCRWTGKVTEVHSTYVVIETQVTIKKKSSLKIHHFNVCAAKDIIPSNEFRKLCLNRLVVFDAAFEDDYFRVVSFKREYNWHALYAQSL